MRIALGLTATLLLSACGSSGGGDGAPAPVNRAKITSANAEAITVAVVEAGLDSAALGAFSSMTPLGAPAGGSEPGTLSKLSRVQASSMSSFKQTLPGQAVVGPILEDCLLGGSMSTTADIASSTGLTPGDSISIDYMDCDQGDGIVVDGPFAMTIVAYEGDASSGMILMTVTIDTTGFEMTDAEGTQILSGRLTLTLDTRSASALSLELSTPNLSVEHGSTTRTLIAYELSRTIAAGGNSVVTSVQGTLSGSEFDGEVDFTTVRTLESDGTSLAYTGEISIVGDSASIRLVVLDGTNLRLEIDLDGDGTADEVRDLTWSGLVEGAA